MFLYSNQRWTLSDRATLSQSTAQTHLLAQSEPCISTQLRSHYYIELALCLIVENSPHSDITSALHHLLQHTEHHQQQYASHSFRTGAATTAAAAGLPAWLIKTLGRWRSNAFQSYIHTSPVML